VALKLMSDADDLMEGHVVDSRHSEFGFAAAMLTSAYATRDMKTVRFATSEFCVIVRHLASQGLLAELNRQKHRHDNFGEGA
jgi:hypothetical protein